MKRWYITVRNKFFIAHLIAIVWMVFSIWVSIPWVKDLAAIVTLPVSILIIAAIGYIPGYINAFTVASLLLDRQPTFKLLSPLEPITVMIACHNEEDAVDETVRYVAQQDYEGPIRILVIDNASTDRTTERAWQAKQNYQVDLDVVWEPVPGKFNGLNTALRQVDTRFVITLDADTLLHKSSLRYLMSRMLSAPEDIAAVAGSVLVRNSRKNLITKIQEWDYFLGIASIKRMQGLYQGTLVAQGAYSMYKTDVLREVGGWPDAIGEDIVLTWRILDKGYRVYYEPKAVSFTVVPETMKHFQKQRSRWARGMIEAIKQVRPWKLPNIFSRYLTTVNLLMPYMDVVYSLVWFPGVILALFGYYWIAGPMTILVIPLAMIQNYILYRYQAHVFKDLGLRIRKNRFGFVVFMLFYQLISSPISVIGYLQELMATRRVWK